MKKFACGDVVQGCEATFAFETEDEIMAAVADHAAGDHGMTEVSPELADTVRSLIAG